MSCILESNSTFSFLFVNIGEISAFFRKPKHVGMLWSRSCFRNKPLMVILSFSGMVRLTVILWSCCLFTGSTEMNQLSIVTLRLDPKKCLPSLRTTSKGLFVFRRKCLYCSRRKFWYHITCQYLFVFEGMQASRPRLHILSDGKRVDN